MRRLLILTFISLSTIAFADNGNGSDAGAAAGSAAPAAAGSGAGSGEIATPAPDANPKKVEQAKQTAQAAALTPIVPSPNNPTRPAYLLYAEIDPPILATGLVFVFGRSNHKAPAYCATAPNYVCTNSGDASINPLDAVTAGYYSAGWSTISDFGLYGLMAASAGILVVDEGGFNALNDGVVVGEATLSATALASIMTLAAGRPRPLLYSDKAPLSIRQSGDAGLSFISSHSAMSFALVTSMFITEHRLHPNSNGPYIMLGVGLGIAGGVATARVMSGYHFITDVVGGAIVGSSVGVMISSIHQSPVKVIPVVNHDPQGNLSGAGLGLTGQF